MSVDVTLPPGRAQLVRELLLGSREVFLERIAELEDTALSLLTTGPLPEAQRLASARTAHQLVSLGTFGVLAARSARRARRGAARRGPGRTPAPQGAALAEIALDLRDELEQALERAPEPVAPQAPSAPRPSRARTSCRRGRRPARGAADAPLEGQGWTATRSATGPRRWPPSTADAAAGPRPARHRPARARRLRGPAGPRHRGLLPALPVLVLTARASEPDVLAALELGARDHVAKPFSLPVLLARVARTVPRG